MLCSLASKEGLSALCLFPSNLTPVHLCQVASNTVLSHMAGDAPHLCLIHVKCACFIYYVPLNLYSGRLVIFMPRWRIM